MNIDFNLNWKFSKAGGQPIIVNLPHDAMLTEQRNPNCHNGRQSGYFPGGKYRYEKTFIISNEDMGKCVEILFEGVYQNCSVLINGEKAGGHRYGYTEFTVDISDYIHAGENTVTVLVDNSLEPNCRWYSGSGIYRPVLMRISKKKHPVTLKVVTKSYAPAIIEIIADKGAEIRIYDGGSLIVSGGAGEYTIPDAKLWSDEEPYLYTCVSRLNEEELSTAFGIRHLEWSAETGLLVNGRRILLRGGCIHHDNGVLGACGFADAERRRVQILKEAGYNAIRSAHNPMSRAMLAACDQMGMYVMDESFDGWYTPKNYHDYSRWIDEDWQGDLTTMVEKDVNHPCVIMYSIGNEVSETASEKGVEFCGMMADFVRSLDGSRPVTCGINVLLNVYTNMGVGVYKDSGEYKAEPLPPKNKRYKEKKTGSTFFNAMAQKLGGLMFFMSAGKKGDRASRGAGEKLDILGLNYAASRYDADVIKYPERIMVGSETMAADLPYNWERVKKYPAVIGDFVWAAWDYLGEACVGDWTYHSYTGLPLLAGSGTVDITGKIGMEAYFQQVVWGLRKKPAVGVRPLNHAGETPTRSAWRFTDAVESWSWHGYEGKTAVVEVFSDAEEIRLELNDRKAGQRKIKDYRCRFKIPYEPGRLTAVALDASGRELSRYTLQTAENETVLKIMPEKTVLHSNGQDLCYIPIEFTDTKGTVKPYIEQEVELSVEGVAILQGFGSAVCKTDESYLGTCFHSFRGRCLAVVRAGTVKGKTKVTVKSAGVEPANVEIEVV